MKTRLSALFLIILAMGIAIPQQLIADQIEDNLRHGIGQIEDELTRAAPEIRCVLTMEEARWCWGPKNPCTRGGDARGVYVSVDPDRSVRRAIAFFRSGDEENAQALLAAAMQGFMIQGRIRDYRAVEAEYARIWCPYDGRRKPVDVDRAREWWAGLQRR